MYSPIINFHTYIPIFFTLLTVLISFTIGSIPTGYLLIKKLYGKNIQCQGSGNIGSTNVNRLYGRKLSILTQIVDITKGLLTILLIHSIFKTQNTDYFLMVASIFCVIGHNYSIFLNFKGGKGINTSIGVLFFQIPLLTSLGIASYFLIHRLTNHAFLGSLALLTSMLAFSFKMEPNYIHISLFVLTLFAYIRHIPNIINFVKKV